MGTEEFMLMAMSVHVGAFYDALVVGQEKFLTERLRLPGDDLNFMDVWEPKSDYRKQNRQRAKSP